MAGWVPVGIKAEDPPECRLRSLTWVRSIAVLDWSSWRHYSSVFVCKAGPSAFSQLRFKTKGIVLLASVSNLFLTLIHCLGTAACNIISQVRVAQSLVAVRQAPSKHCRILLAQMGSIQPYAARSRTFCMLINLHCLIAWQSCYRCWPECKTSLLGRLKMAVGVYWK